MKRHEWFFIWIAGCFACVALGLMIIDSKIEQPATSQKEIKEVYSGPDVVITGVFSLELFSGEISYYVNYLVDTQPATHDFKSDTEAMEFIRMLEQRYHATWMAD